MIKFILGIILAVTVQSAWADGIGSLKDYFLNTNTMRATFKQEVMDKEGSRVQSVEGTMQLKRPNMFRWDYHKPYEQQIVSDGQQVFLYDIDLEQVTVRSLGRTIGSSPAALLAGGKAVEDAFTLKNAVRKDSLTWVLALPKDKDSGYERLILGFREGKLRKMELYDSFSHVTHITFDNIERNPKLDVKDFLFTPPQGADVVGE